jgi:hypothetical protein
MNQSKRAVAAVVAACLTFGAAGTALADETPRSDPACINVVMIDHTQVLDDSNILFFLKGGRTVKNVLADRCFGLRMATRGFTYVARNDEVCGNLQTIRVNDTGSVCMLGPFVPYTPVPAAAK